MTDNRSAKPLSKWADCLRVITGDPSRIYEFPDWNNPFVDVFQVTGLEKTPLELTVIEFLLETINLLREGLAGLPAVVIDPNRLNLMEPGQFHKSIMRTANRSSIRGKTFRGRVYACRDDDPVATLATLAHELVHLTAYTWYDIYDDPAQQAATLDVPRILLRRNGMVQIDPAYDTLLPHFNGLNEMVTETFAMALRKSLVQRTNLLGEAAGARLAGFCASPPQVVFLEKVMAELAQAGHNREQAVATLFGDLCGGTDRFLEALEGPLPGATEILRRTGALPNELATAAEEFGWDDHAKFMRCHGPASGGSE